MVRVSGGAWPEQWGLHCRNPEGSLQVPEKLASVYPSSRDNRSTKNVGFILIQRPDCGQQ